MPDCLALTGSHVNPRSVPGDICWAAAGSPTLFVCFCSGSCCHAVVMLQQLFSHATRTRSTLKPKGSEMPQIVDQEWIMRSIRRRSRLVNCVFFQGRPISFTQSDHGYSRNDAILVYSPASFPGGPSCPSCPWLRVLQAWRIAGTVNGPFVRLLEIVAFRSCVFPSIDDGGAPGHSFSLRSLAIIQPVPCSSEPPVNPPGTDHAA